MPGGCARDLPGANLPDKRPETAEEFKARVLARLERRVAQRRAEHAEKGSPTTFARVAECVVILNILREMEVA